MHRFYIEPASWDAEALVLDEAESHHATSVLRLGAGDKIVAFNGQGTEATAEITSTDGGTATLKTLTLTKTAPLSCRLILGQAVPKGKNMDLVVQKSTELGVAEIVPVLSSRTVVSLDAEDAVKKRDKWQHTAIGACKQSGQNWLPKIAPPIAIDRFLAAPPQADLVLIASLQPGSRHLKEILAEYHELHDSAPPTSVLVLIGPEGDFTPSEVNQACAAGALPLSLGPVVLRTETASIYSLSILAHELF